MSTTTRRIVSVIVIVWGAAMVMTGFRYGLAYDTAYNVGRTSAYLFGWILIGAGISGLRPNLRNPRQRELDLY